MVAERNLPNEGGTKKMSYLFQRWLITLGAQVYALQKSMASKDTQRLRREAADSEAELQALYGYAQQHQMSILPYAAAFTKIEGRLRLIDDHLREREARTE
jgi:hypothetical protein